MTRCSYCLRLMRTGLETSWNSFHRSGRATRTYRRQRKKGWRERMNWQKGPKTLKKVLNCRAFETDWSKSWLALSWGRSASFCFVYNFEKACSRSSWGVSRKPLFQILFENKFKSFSFLSLLLLMKLLKGLEDKPARKSKLRGPLLARHLSSLSSDKSKIFWKLSSDTWNWKLKKKVKTRSFASGRVEKLRRF